MTVTNWTTTITCPSVIGPVNMWVTRMLAKGNTRRYLCRRTRNARDERESKWNNMSPAMLRQMMAREVPRTRSPMIAAQHMTVVTIVVTMTLEQMLVVVVLVILLDNLDFVSQVSIAIIFFLSMNID